MVQEKTGVLNRSPQLFGRERTTNNFKKNKTRDLLRVSVVATKANDKHHL